MPRSDMTSNSMAALGLTIIFLAILWFIFMPVAVVFAANTLFGTALAYSLKTWASVHIFSLFAGGIVRQAKSK